MTHTHQLMTHTQQLMTQTKQLITISFPVRLKSTQQVRDIRLIYSFNQNTSILIRINLEELLVKQTIWPPDLKRLFKAFQKEADRNKQKEASSRVEIADQDVCRRRKFERKQGHRSAALQTTQAGSRLDRQAATAGTDTTPTKVARHTDQYLTRHKHTALHSTIGIPQLVKVRKNSDTVIAFSSQPVLRH